MSIAIMLLRLGWLLHDRLKYGRKNAVQLAFYTDRWYKEGRKLLNSHFERRMLGMAGESDAEFVRDKVVADSGCGPRGSLCWATPAKERIGIDVLADAYRRFGIGRHNMRYVRSTEEGIPLPSRSVDILFTMNTLDYVTNLARVSAELLRILIPGGLFIGSFNLNEPSLIRHAPTLTEECLWNQLLNQLEVVSCRRAPHGPAADLYSYFFREEVPAVCPEEPYYLWVHAMRPVRGASVQ